MTIRLQFTRFMQVPMPRDRDWAVRAPAGPQPGKARLPFTVLLQLELKRACSVNYWIWMVNEDCAPPRLVASNWYAPTGKGWLGAEYSGTCTKPTLASGAASSWIVLSSAIDPSGAMSCRRTERLAPAGQFPSWTRARAQGLYVLGGSAPGAR